MKDISQALVVFDKVLPLCRLHHVVITTFCTVSSTSLVTRRQITDLGDLCVPFIPASSFIATLTTAGTRSCAPSSFAQFTIRPLSGLLHIPLRRIFAMPLR